MATVARTSRTSTKTRRGSSSRGSRVPVKWQRLMALIPGYDPIATAPPGYYFDVAEAERYCDFFPEMLVHVMGRKGGQPFTLEPHQRAKTGCIFGWKQPDGLRRYREVFDYEPRKQGKSPWTAGIVLAVLMMDPEAGIRAYSAASDKDQAGLVYQYAYGMVLAKPALKKRLKIYTATKSFEYQERFAYYHVLSSVPESKHGLNVHLAIIDETHAHKTDELINVLSTGTAARSQPLIIHTTTADWLRESVCNAKYDYACKVRDRMIEDPAFLPILYEATPPADEDTDELWWTQERAWRQANPNLGVSVELDYIRRACQEAMQVPRKRNTFKRLHLNIRTGQDTAWFGLDAWDACYDSALDVEALQGQECFAGLDLASVSDLTAFVLWFPAQQTFRAYFWLPTLTVQARYDRSSVPYPLWVDQGYIRTTPGNRVDQRHIHEEIAAIREQYQIREVALDRWNEGSTTVTLQGMGLEVVPFGLGYASMNAPSKHLEAMILGRDLRHDGNPVMRWQASHIAVEEDPAGNIKPSKGRSPEKIDGFTALIMAIGRALVAEPAPGPSIYDTRGALLF